MSRYVGPIKWLGGIAIGMFIFAFLFANIAPGLVSEETRNGVLFHAIPFFGAFVGVLLLYILVIVLIAMRFNGKIPGRTYRNVENLIVVAILFGTVCLFNPWSFVPYRYGFLIVLVATLSFILWSHITAPRASYDASIPPLSRNQQAIGLVAGVVVFAVLMGVFINATSPQPPYGLRQRVYDSYDEARKATVAEEATREFNTVELPFLVIFNLFPATLAYLIVRELGAGEKSKTAPMPDNMSRVGAQ
jgi:hypothetical protein